MSKKLLIKDVDTAMADGSFFDMSPADATMFIEGVASNPDNQLDGDAAFDYLMGEYGRRMATQVFVESAQVSAAYGDTRRDVVKQSVCDAAGMTASQFETARAGHNAGESSDILKAYGKFLRSC